MKIKNSNLDFFNSKELRKTTNKKDNFENYLPNDTKKSNNSKENVKTDIKNKDQNIIKSDSKNNDKENVSNESNNKKVNLVKETENKKVSTEENMISEEDVLKVLADELGISVEEIEAILNSMNITIQDLQLNENVTEFLKLVHGVENTAELLTIEGVKEQFNIVKETTAKLPKEAVDELESLENTEVIENTNMQSENSKNTSNQESFNNNEENLHDSEETVLQTSTTSTDKENVKDLVNTDTKEEKVNDLSGQKTSIEQNIKLDNFIEQNVQVADKEIVEIENLANKIANKNLPINQQNVVDQVLNIVKTEIKADTIGSEIKIMLKPAHLGDVTLKVATENGIITAQFIAESQKIKEIIESNFNQLKDSMAEQGLDISSLEVSVRDDSNKEENSNNQNTEQSFYSNEELEVEDTVSTNKEQKEKILGSSVSYAV